MRETQKNGAPSNPAPPHPAASQNSPQPGPSYRNASAPTVQQPDDLQTDMTANRPVANFTVTQVSDYRLAHLYVPVFPIGGMMLIPIDIQAIENSLAILNPNSPYPAPNANQNVHIAGQTPTGQASVFRTHESLLERMIYDLKMAREALTTKTPLERDQIATNTILLVNIIQTWLNHQTLSPDVQVKALITLAEYTNAICCYSTAASIYELLLDRLPHHPLRDHIQSSRITQDDHTRLDWFVMLANNKKDLFLTAGMFGHIHIQQQLAIELDNIKAIIEIFKARNVFLSPSQDVLFRKIFYNA